MHELVMGLKKNWVAFYLVVKNWLNVEGKIMVGFQKGPRKIVLIVFIFSFDLPSLFIE